MSNKINEVEKRIIGEVYSSTESYDNLRVLCDQYGGRMVGTPENRGAADFLLSKFIEYGFDNPHLEEFDCPSYKDAKSELELLKPKNRKISCLTLPMTPSGEVEAGVIYVGGGENISEKLDQIDGKIALCTNRTPISKVTEAGATGIIWMHPFPSMGPPTGVVRSKIPAVSVKYEDGLMIKRFMEINKNIKLRLFASLTPIKTKSWNVCGEIPGNGSSNEFLMFGGHYDGHEIAQAAFDCGAPCTISTEIGRVLSTVNDKLDRDVRVVLFSSEEFGCQGSQDYAKRHASDMANMRFTYQLDCTGGPRTQMVTTAYWDKLDVIYQKLAEDLQMNIPYEHRMGPGDTRAFMELGIPTGCIMDHRGPKRDDILQTYRHTYYDTFDKIDIRSVREATIIGALSGFRMLNMSNFPEHRSPEEIEKITN